MAEYTLSFVDERPELSIELDEYTLSYTDAGIQGAAGPGILVKGSVEALEALPEDAEINDGYFIGENLYVFSEASEWINAGLVKGADGQPGPEGPQGPMGPAGERGPVGPQGLTGLQGPKGEKGERGDAGPKGDKGDVGLTGATGPQGPRGLTGPEGPKGDRGNTGPQGLIGPVGPQGVQGIQGVKGDVGPEGPTGPRGPMGLTGPVGPKGDTGAAGPQGPAGLDGPTGDFIATYRGTYTAGVSYDAGDLVTHIGQTWLALNDTMTTPVEGENWTLVAARSAMVSARYTAYEPVNDTTVGWVQSPNGSLTADADGLTLKTLAQEFSRAVSAQALPDVNEVWMEVEVYDEPGVNKTAGLVLTNAAADGGRLSVRFDASGSNMTVRVERDGMTNMGTSASFARTAGWNKLSFYKLANSVSVYWNDELKVTTLGGSNAGMHPGLLVTLGTTAKFRNLKVDITGQVPAKVNGVLSGIGGPNNTWGIRGDYWMDTANWVLYGPKAAVWPETGVSLVGPQGVPGSVGLTGPMGPQGPEGPQGPAGPQGIQGPEGPVGPKGEQGTGVSIKGTLNDVSELPAVPEAPENAWLIDGDLYVWDGAKWINVGQIQGPQGDTGAVGPMGPQGPQGETGPQGIQGVEGPQGIQGEVGPEGPMGPQGPQGATGETGPEGPVGPAGEDGSSGFIVYDETLGAYPPRQDDEPKTFYGPVNPAALMLVGDTWINSAATGEDILYALKEQALPEGGTAGQVLAKVDATDFNAAWIDAPTGGGNAVEVKAGTEGFYVRDPNEGVGSGYNISGNVYTVYGTTGGSLSYGWSAIPAPALPEQVFMTDFNIHIPNPVVGQEVRIAVPTAPGGGSQSYRIRGVFIQLPGAIDGDLTIEIGSQSHGLHYTATLSSGWDRHRATNTNYAFTNYGGDVTYLYARVTAAPPTPVDYASVTIPCRRVVSGYAY